MITNAAEPKPASGPSPVDELDRLARDQIDAFEGTIRLDGSYKSRIYQSARSASLQLAADYGRRFLVELIQNAHDAQPANSEDGEVRIVFDPSEGASGCLYVANMGRGFGWSNVEALCSIGLSDKPPGEAIGNKGLGFRSVVHISDDPQVFSSRGSGTSETFNGYCFRFAAPTDLSRWITDPTRREMASRDLPLFHVPVSLTDVPKQAQLLCRAGFVTVVRLPLRNDRARQTVREELGALQTCRAPLLLFLQRLRRVQVEVVGEQEHSYSLCRQSTPLSMAKMTNGRSDAYAAVDLGDRGRYFVASTRVPEELVRRQITASIEEKSVSPTWADWTGDGEVAVATPLDDISIAPLLYTFLPLGEAAEAPFHGFLHGSFYPNAERTSLRAGVPLNALYINEAADLCARTILALRRDAEDTAPSLSDEQLERVVLDLLCWRSVPSTEGGPWRSIARLLASAFARQGADLEHCPILPVERRPIDEPWAGFDEVWQWRFIDFRVLSAKSLVTHANVPILPARLGKDRLGRVDAFARAVNGNRGLDPTGSSVAVAIERVAENLETSSAAVDDWRAFYRELKTVCSAPGWQIDLQGRKILLCSDWQLRPAEATTPTPLQPKDEAPDPSSAASVKPRRRRRRVPTAGPAVFLPSRRATGDQVPAGGFLEIPEELAAGFAFLNEQLDWYGDLEDARTFLEQRKLVRSYDSEEIITQVSAITARDKRVKVCQAALAWSFRLWHASRSSRPITNLRRTRLPIPSIDGRWMDAGDVVFSKGWPAETNGDLLDDFLTTAAPHSDDLSRLLPQRLASPRTRPFSIGRVKEWAEFLTLLGVQRGLVPTRREARNFRLRGTAFSPEEVGRRLSIGEETIRLWRGSVSPSQLVPYRQSSDYELDGSVWLLPGQDDYLRFPVEARITFAQLILSWLDTQSQPVAMEGGYWRVGFVTRSARYQGRREWPTPLAAFVRRANWFPIERWDGETRSTQFTQPNGVWLPTDGAYEIPPYMPQLPRRLRGLVARPGMVEQLARRGGINIIDRKSALPGQIAYLASLFASQSVEPYYRRALLNDYFDTWRRLGRELPGFDWEQSERPKFLIARQNGEYLALNIVVAQGANRSGETSDARQQPVYVRDTQDRIKVALVEARGFPTFDVGGQLASGLLDSLKRLLKGRYRPLSDVEVAVLVDGQPLLEPNQLDDPAVARCPWLPIVLCLAMESVSGAVAQRLPADRGLILDRLRRIRLQRGSIVTLRVDGAEISLPDGLHGAISFPHEGWPTVVVQSESDSLTWDDVTRAARPICEALDHSDLTQAVVIGLRTLERLGESVRGPIPGDQRARELCDELHVGAADAAAALAVLNGSVDRLTSLIRPMVHYYGGSGAMDQFTEAVASAVAVADLSTSLAAGLTWDRQRADRVLEAGLRARGFGDLRDELQLEFGPFNASLVAAGEKPELHPAAHADAIELFIASHRDEIFDCLRAPHIARFALRDSLVEYVRGRDALTKLEPLPGWLFEYREPPEDVIKKHVDHWLATYAAPPLGYAGSILTPYSVARRDNMVAIKQFARAYAQLVGAWCRKRQVELPPVWQAPFPAVADDLFQLLDDLGSLDFDVLTETEIEKWLEQIPAWPAGMPATRSLEALGLTAGDLDVEAERKRQERIERERNERSVDFNGQRLDPQEANYDQWAAELAATMSRQVRATSLGMSASLLAPSPRDHRHSGGPGDGGVGAPPRRIHPDKAGLIGFLGECAVYEWLKGALPNQDIDAAWVSSLAARLLPKRGDDSLGYDFKIRYGRQTWFLEVKAHLGDPLQFELGETEVRFARDCAQRRGVQFKVVYIANIQDAGTMRIEVLPNPLSDEGREQFQIRGEGLRYRFQRAPSSRGR